MPLIYIDRVALENQHKVVGPPEEDGDLVHVKVAREAVMIEKQDDQLHDNPGIVHPSETFILLEEILDIGVASEPECLSSQGAPINRRLVLITILLLL